MFTSDSSAAPSSEAVASNEALQPTRIGPWTLFLVFLRLGLTSFGGPIAHLGYFQTEFVQRRRWLSDARYADLVALCQFLPGPASSQVGIALGLTFGGYPGAVAAWAGFTLPSAALMTLLGLGLTRSAVQVDPGLLHGLKLVAVAIVAQAVWTMSRRLCPDRQRITLAVIAAIWMLWWPAAVAQLAAIAAGAIAGALLLRPPALPASIDAGATPPPSSRRTGLAWLTLLAVSLVGLPILADVSGSSSALLADRFFRAGALVFGGGHVMLPLLQAAVVPPGWVGNDAFLAGYGAAQALPGPLSTFAAYLGAIAQAGPGGWAGAALGLVAIFAPAFLLVFGAWPLWQSMRHRPAIQRATAGVNAAVVGILLAALYQPVWNSAVASPLDVAQVIAAYAALVVWQVPPWLLVIASAGIGMLRLAG